MEDILQHVNHALCHLIPPLIQRVDEEEFLDAECHLASPGRYNPADNDDGVIINGVVVPRLVADQLRRLGVSLSFYTTGQLEAAIQGCRVDCTLVDDPEGIGFFDDLMLDGRERDEEDDRVGSGVYSRDLLHMGNGDVFTELSESKSIFFTAGFREQLKNEREQRRKRNRVVDGDDL